MKKEYLVAGGLVAAFFVAVAVFWRPAPPARPALSARDRDLVIRTVWAEAGRESRLGKVAVAWVIKNRRGHYGWKTYGRVVTACGTDKKTRRLVCQFEPWIWEKTRKRMEKFSKDRQSLAYKSIGKIVDGVMAGQIPDPTGGAFYFENRAITKQRGRPGLCKTFIKIGHHNFCRKNQQAGLVPVEK